MKSALFLAFVLAVVSPALAESALGQHEAEARSFLVPCPQADPQDRDICQQSQQSFVKVYVEAMAGDFLSTVAVIWALSPSGNDYVARTMSPGIPPNPVEACAWSYLLFNTTGRQAAYKEAFIAHCKPIGDTGRNAAMTRFKQIAGSIDLEAKPPADWKPRIDGLRDH